MWALVTKNGAVKPLSHRFAALWEPIWGLQHLAVKVAHYASEMANA